MTSGYPGRAKSIGMTLVSESIAREQVGGGTNVSGGIVGIKDREK